MPCILTCSFKQKKIKYIERDWIEKFGMPNQLFLTLVWFISLSDVMVSSWKFYHSFSTTAPTYPKNFMPLECTWAEIDFRGGRGLALIQCLRIKIFIYHFKLIDLQVYFLPKVMTTPLSQWFGRLAFCQLFTII
jgi:hypothetical protein